MAYRVNRMQVGTMQFCFILKEADYVVIHLSSIMMVSMYESKVADANDFPLSDKSASDVRRMSFDVLNPCSLTSQDTMALAFILRSLRALPSSLFSLIFIV
jgi:hypothetical protein